MTNDIDWTRLARYLAGECTPTEAEEIRRWIEADPAHAHLVGELRAAWNAAGTPAADWDTPGAWRRLAARLRTRDRRPMLTLVRGDRIAGRRRSHRPLRLIALATAALLALVVGAWWAGTSSRSGAEIAAAPPLREVRVPMGQRAQFQLIDGTRVLAAIDLERQLELAFEGERWPDLVRTGRAVEELGIPEYQTLYPIPQTEIDVAPGITQNPGY